MEGKVKARMHASAVDVRPSFRGREKESNLWFRSLKLE